MKRFLSVLLLPLLLVGCSGQSGAAYRQVTMEEAIRLMEEERGYLILDVRTRSEFDEGHIPGAVCLPNEEISADTVTALTDKGQLLLVYCRSGNRSKQAAKKLAELGYTNVVEFGGILDWPGEIEY